MGGVDLVALVVAAVVRAHRGENLTTFVTWAVVIGGALWLGLQAQRRLLERIDPDGSLRAAVRDQH